MVNNDSKVFAVAEKIQDRGLYLQPVTYPAVPKHKSRLRISVSAAHTEEQLERAVPGDRGRAARRGRVSELTRYGYRARAVSGFFEFPTENARRILPSHLEPIEVHHGTSIFAMTAFDFNESSVGPYGEVVMAVIVVARSSSPASACRSRRSTRTWSATTTKAARDHAIERWHLPHWMEDVEIVLRPRGRTHHGQGRTWPARPSRR